MIKIKRKIVKKTVLCIISGKKSGEKKWAKKLFCPYFSGKFFRKKI
jgi:hypothetical protein